MNTDNVVLSRVSLVEKSMLCLVPVNHWLDGQPETAYKNVVKHVVVMDIWLVIVCVVCVCGVCVGCMLRVMMETLCIASEWTGEVAG